MAHITPRTVHFPQLELDTDSDPEDTAPRRVKTPMPVGGAARHREHARQIRDVWGEMEVEVAVAAKGERIAGGEEVGIECTDRDAKIVRFVSVPGNGAGGENASSDDGDSESDGEDVRAKGAFPRTPTPHPKDWAASHDDSDCDDFAVDDAATGEGGTASV